MKKVLFALVVMTGILAQAERIDDPSSYVFTDLTSPLDASTRSSGSASQSGFPYSNVFNREYGPSFRWLGYLNTTENPGPAWVSYTFKNATVINAFSVMNSHYEYDKNSPKAFKLLASDDFTVGSTYESATWVELDAEEESGWGSQERRYFKFTNETAYKTYCLRISSVVGESAKVQMYELELFNLPTDYFVISGSPAQIGTPVPGYGMLNGLEKDREYSFDCPSSVQAETYSYDCIGWTLKLTNGDETTGSGTNLTIVYSSAYAKASLTWRWSVKSRIAVKTSCAGETADADPVWTDVKGRVLVSAPETPRAGYAFVYWTGSGVSRENRFANPLPIVTTEPGTVTAVYAPVRYAGGPTASDETGDGLSAATAFATIQKAVDDCGTSEDALGLVRVAEGTYEMSTTLFVSNRVSVVAAGDRAKTVVRTTDGNRALLLGNAFARMTGFSFADGHYQVARWGRGYVILIESKGGTLDGSQILDNDQSVNSESSGAVAVRGEEGVVARCVVRGNRNKEELSRAGGINLEGGGLVTDCLVVSNTACYGGGVSVVKGLLRNCTVVDNEALAQAGGLALGTTNIDYDPESRIVNLIVSGNREPAAGSARTGYPEWGVVKKAAATDVDSTASYVCTGEADALGSEALAGTPVFKSRARGDFRLKPQSVGFKSGSYASWMYGAMDVNGNPRVLKSASDGTPLVDIGCVESDLVIGGFSILIR